MAFIRHKLFLAAVVMGLVILAPGISYAQSSVISPVPFSQNDFSGTVVFKWRGGHGQYHQSKMGIQDIQGKLLISSPRGSKEIVRIANLSNLPQVGSKYNFIYKPGIKIAGRATRQIEIKRGAYIVEKVWVDVVSGIVLKSQLFSRKGYLTRSMSFEKISFSKLNPKATNYPYKPANKVSAQDLPSIYQAPAHLFNGYQRIEILKTKQRVEIVYSDGLRTISVFEQVGKLSHPVSPHDNKNINIGYTKASSYDWVGGEVLVWQAGPCIYTLVADDSSNNLATIAKSIPRSHSLDLLQRIGNESREIVEMFVGHY